MKILKIISLLLISFSLYNCTSKPNFGEYSNKIPKLNPEEARVFIFRPGTLGAAIRPSIELDGNTTAYVGANSFIYVDVPAGEHELLVKTRKVNSLRFSVEKGENVYIRLNARLGVLSTQVIPMLREYPQALAEIKSTHFSNR